MASSQALLTMEGIDKAFNGVPALRNASLQVNRAEVRALIGQNGAGKSTMIKVLTGVYSKDAGVIHFDGAEVEFDSPNTAQRNGIATIYQEVNLVPYRSVAENIFLGHAHKRRGLLDWKTMNRQADELLRDRLHMSVDVSRPLQDYTIATQQMTAIARALSFDAKLVIMDEPTSSLAEAEVQRLFEVIRRLKADGVSVLFVSHRLDELFAVCDRVTVMRDGQTVKDAAMSEITKYQLVSLMIGRELAKIERRSEADAPELAIEPLVSAEALSRPPVLRDVSLQVRPGEIVGLAGLLGSGRSETARALFGLDHAEGTVTVASDPVRFRSPRDAIASKFGFLAEDRKAEGIIPGMSVKENMTLAALPAITRQARVDTGRQTSIYQQYVESLSVACAGPDQPIEELSGGNQQKVLIARWLATHPKFLILDEPTRGIDVGAKAEILRLIRKLADDGVAVLLISSENEELIASCDRVIVLRDGTSVTELVGDEISEDSIMQAMASGSAQTAAEELNQ